ncbi:MAG: hypothetical protein AAB723_00795, partial [Patescibacteria group bacterium]
KKSSLFSIPIHKLLTIFLTVSEGDITSLSSQRKIIGNKKDGSPKYGEMKLKDAIYSYPAGFNIDKAIEETMNGSLYKRIGNE